MMACCAVSELVCSGGCAMGWHQSVVSYPHMPPPRQSCGGCVHPLPSSRLVPLHRRWRSSCLGISTTLSTVFRFRFIPLRTALRPPACSSPYSTSLPLILHPLPLLLNQHCMTPALVTRGPVIQRSWFLTRSPPSCTCFRTLSNL